MKKKKNNLFLQAVFPDFYCRSGPHSTRPSSVVTFRTFLLACSLPHPLPTLLPPTPTVLSSAPRGQGSGTPSRVLALAIKQMNEFFQGAIFGILQRGGSSSAPPACPAQPWLTVFQLIPCPGLGELFSLSLLFLEERVEGAPAVFTASALRDSGMPETMTICDRCD